MRRILLASFLLCMILFGNVQGAFSEEAEVNPLTHAPNIAGLTGLTRTDSAETIGPRQISLGASGEFEDSQSPDLQRFTLRGTLTVGVTRVTELALVFPYIKQSGEDGAGDLEIAGK